MSVAIRLRRTGRKNLPCFRITVTDSRFPRDGRSLETLGLYDPLRKDPAQMLKLDHERTQHWINQGARVSDIVQSLFKRMGVFPPKPKVKRERPKRKVKTATFTRKKAAQAARAEAKKARAVQRKAATKAAAPAADKA